MKNEIIRLEVKKDIRIIPEIAMFVSNTASKLNLSEKKTYYLCFVLETVLELRMKEIEDGDSSIIISVIDDGQFFSISVTDFGKPYILTKNQQEILRKKIVDRFAFEQNGRNGQRLSFSYSYEPKPQKLTTPLKEELLDENFSFRKLKYDDEDILSAINCLYASYGFEYYHQNLYSLYNFKKFIRSGRYIPIIGENDHKQKMCYCALDENLWFEGVPELSNLVTNPIARGKGLATRIFKETENIAILEGYEGIHVSAVAYHPYTQKMCNKFSYTPAAIEYSINPPGTGGYDSKSRLDCVIGIKIFNKNKKHDLYIDEKCNDVISSIFKSEELACEIHNETCSNDIEVSDIAYIIDTDTNNCFIKLDVCSKNIENEVNDILNKQEIKQLDVITVNLNMNHQNSLDGYKALRSKGFICGGAIIGTKNGDYMLLQNFKVEPNYENIVLEDNYKELQLKLNMVNNS